MKKAEIAQKFDEIVDFSGVETYIDTPVKRYSSGMYVRLAFAVAAHLDPEILVVDEVLAVGDVEFQKKCLGKMGEVAREGRTVLLVSHNLTLIQNLCNKTIYINSGVLAYLDNTENVIRMYMQEISGLQQTRNIIDRQDRKGNQFLKFTKVVICDDQGKEINQVLSGQEVNIRLHYISKKEIQNANVLVAFNISYQGFVISNLNSQDSGDMDLNIFDEGYFECKWQHVNLISGAYACTIFCSINGEIVDWVISAFMLNIENGDFFKTGQLIKSDGSVLIPHSWSSLKE